MACIWRWIEQTGKTLKIYLTCDSPYFPNLNAYFARHQSSSTPAHWSPLLRCNYSEFLQINFYMRKFACAYCAVRAENRKHTQIVHRSSFVYYGRSKVWVKPNGTLQFHRTMKFLSVFSALLSPLSLSLTLFLYVFCTRRRYGCRIIHHNAPSYRVVARKFILSYKICWPWKCILRRTISMFHFH